MSCMIDTAQNLDDFKTLIDEIIVIFDLTSTTKTRTGILLHSRSAI